jgi:ankyrin repeat protein
MNPKLLRLAQSAQLDKATKEDFDTESLTKLDLEGYNVLHYAALNNQLHFVPQEFLIPKTLAIKSQKGLSTYFYATKNNCITAIPKKSFTSKCLEEREKGKSIISVLAQKDALKYIDKEIITKDLVLDLDTYDTSNPEPRVIHTIARSGRIKDIPTHILEEEVLLLKKDSDLSVAHCAALAGCLKDIPPHLLTNKVIEAKDSEGATPIHLAAHFGHLDKVPKNILTPEVIKKTNDLGSTILHYATINNENSLKNIPKYILTEEYLLVEDSEGYTPLDYAIENYDPSDIKELKFIIKNLTITGIKTTITKFEKKQKEDKGLLYIENNNSLNAINLLKKELVKRKIVRDIQIEEEIRI